MFVRFADVPRNEPGASRGAVKIYALIDPRDDGVRYVGVTRQKLEARLAQHLKSPTNWRTRAWFTELRSCGLEPEIENLQQTGRNWEIAEMQWIAWFRARGDLLNVDAGGMLVDAGTGWDDIKREKAAGILATALVHAAGWALPPCAQDQRTGMQKRAQRKAEKIRKASGSVNGLEAIKLKVGNPCQVFSSPPRLFVRVPTVASITLARIGDAGFVFKRTKN